MPLLKKYFKIWWLQAFYSFISGCFLLLYIYFIKNQVSIFYILIGELCAFGLIVIYLIFRGVIYSRRTMIAGLILEIISILILLLPFRPFYLVIPYFVLAWLAAILFFTPYNVLYFEKTLKEKHLQEMTFYWAVSIVIGVFAPLVAAYIWHIAGLTLFITIYVLFTLAGLNLLRYVPKEVYSYSIKQGLQHLRSLRTINMVDGALHRVNGIVIVIFSLQYINNELDFGKFLSIVSLVALFFAFPMAKLSDRWQKRTIFIWPLSLFAGLITMSFYFVNQFWQFFFLALILKAVLVLTEPIRSNIIQDKKEKLPITWISREIYLNIGRFLLMVILVPMLYFGWLKETFLVMGILSILFPVLVYYKKIYVPAAVN